MDVRVGPKRRLSIEELMLLNFGAGEDSAESLGLQKGQTHQSLRKSTLNIHRKDWCWSWSSSALATWCKELTHWKRPWCWQRLKAGGEEGDRGWNGEIFSSMNVILSNLQEIVKNREAWHAAVHGVAKSWTCLSDWTTASNSKFEFRYY